MNKSFALLALFALGFQANHVMGMDDPRHPWARSISLATQAVAKWGKEVVLPRVAQFEAELESDLQVLTELCNQPVDESFSPYPAAHRWAENFAKVAQPKMQVVVDQMAEGVNTKTAEIKQRIKRAFEGKKQETVVRMKQIAKDSIQALDGRDIAVIHCNNLFDQSVGSRPVCDDAQLCLVYDRYKNAWINECLACQTKLDSLITIAMIDNGSEVVLGQDSQEATTEQKLAAQAQLLAALRGSKHEKIATDALVSLATKH